MRRLPSGWTGLQKRMLATTDDERAVRGVDFSGREVALDDGGGWENLEPLRPAVLGGVGKCAGPRVVGADPPLDGDGVLRPVEVAVFAVQLGNVAGSGVVLRDARRGAGREFCQSLREHGGSDVREPVVERATGLVRGNGDGFRKDDIAGIELADHVHRGNPGLRIAGIYSGLDASGPAVFRQQRGVQVDDGALGSV